MSNYIVLQNSEERYAPPEDDVMLIGLVGDTVFLSIGEHGEGSSGVPDADSPADSTVLRGKAGISVNIFDLLNSLMVLASIEERRNG